MSFPLWLFLASLCLMAGAITCQVVHGRRSS